MIPINYYGTLVLDKLWKMAKEHGEYFILNNNKAFIPLTVEIITTKQISLCHHFDFCGCLMCYPEMVFYKYDVQYIAIYYRNDYLGKEQVSVTVDSYALHCKNYFMQAEHTFLAEKWLKLIKKIQKI